MKTFKQIREKVESSPKMSHTHPKSEISKNNDKTASSKIPTIAVHFKYTDPNHAVHTNDVE